MSILYVNPGYASLFEDHKIPSYENNDEKHTRCGRYVIPLDYKNWYTVYTNDKIFDWHIRFDVYVNLSNKTYEDYEGFLKLCDYKYDLTLSIDSMANLVISSGEDVIQRLDFDLDTINSYELRLFSKENEKEVIQLWKDEKLIYSNNGIPRKYFEEKSPFALKIKNIVYTPNDDNLRHGTALSNFVIGNSRIGNVSIDILDCDITSDWINSYTTTEEGKYITQKIKNIDTIIESEKKDECIYAVVNAMVNAKSTQDNDIVSFLVNNTRINESFLPVIDKKGITSDVMETNPIEGVFWYSDNIINKEFKLKSGGFME